MPIVSAETLKAYFESGKVPTESNYIDLIDTTFPGAHTHEGTDIISAVAEADNADTLDNLHAADFHRVSQNIVNSNDIILGGGLTVGAASDWAGSGDVAYFGNLLSRKSSITYTVHALKFLDDFIEAETYHGYTTSTFTKTSFAIATEFPGCPSGAMGLILSISLNDTASAANDCLVCVGPTSESANGFIARCSGIANGKWSTAWGIAKTNGSGTAYIQATASGTNTLTMNVRLYGYAI